MAGLTESGAYDITIEKGLVGLAMQFAGNDECRRAMLSTTPEDWWHHSTRELAIVVSEMMVANAVIDPTTVLAEAQTRGLVPARISPAFALECVQLGWTPQAAPQLAQRIRDLSAARKLSMTAIRMAQRMESAWQDGLDAVDLGAAITELRHACDDVEQGLVVADAPPPMSMAEFLDVPDDQRDWLIPGLLERQERIVLTGVEGGGKSVLCAQLATCMAAGIHPFTAEPLGSRDDYGIRVLIIDCENSAGQTRRRFRNAVRMVDTARDSKGLAPAVWADRMFVEVRPAGINLLDPRDAAWLERCITATAPHLLVLGPLYKLHHANPNDETVARELVWVLDNMRERHGFALLTEAHAGNSSDANGDRMMRPIGSSLWRRWPEFGFGLRRAKGDPGKDRAQLVDVAAWRGAREERAWPSQLQHSYILPWMPADPDYYLQSNRIGSAA